MRISLLPPLSFLSPVVCTIDRARAEVLDSRFWIVYTEAAGALAGGRFSSLTHSLLFTDAVFEYSVFVSCLCICYMVGWGVFRRRPRIFRFLTQEEGREGGKKRTAGGMLGNVTASSLNSEGGGVVRGRDGWIYVLYLPLALLLSSLQSCVRLSVCVRVCVCVCAASLVYSTLIYSTPYTYLASRTGPDRT